MVNYGYKCEGWTLQHKQELAMALAPLCDKEADLYGMHPYTEIDGLYNGVRIRRITHLNKQWANDLVLKADRIYRKLGKKFGY